jgi:hypothetical protein
MDLLDVRLRLGLELGQRPGTGILGGSLHRLCQIGHELALLARAGRERRFFSRNSGLG